MGVDEEGSPSADQRRVTRPREGGGILDHAGCDRVEVDIEK